MLTSKKILLSSLFMLTFSHITLPKSWLDMLNDHRKNMTETVYQFLTKQYNDYILGQAPKIADPRIKQIPIIENNEEVIDITAINHPRISIMTDQECPAAHDYVGDIDPRSNGFSKMRKSVFHALQRMINHLDRLALEFGYQPGMLEIKLFEGLRDLATQKLLFDEKMAACIAANPTMTLQQAYDETCKWVSPYIDNIPVHSTGAAVDIALFDQKSQRFCNMGRFNTGGKQAPTFTADESLTEEQKNNRLLFLIAATKAGLTNYLNEFWHFSLGDRYAAYYREEDPALRQAQYGSV